MNKVRAAWRKYQAMSPAVKTSVWFTICNFLQRGMSIITVPIFTRILTTDEYGICNIYFAWFDMLVIFTSLKLPFEGFNNGLIRHEDDKDGYASSVAGLILTMTAFLCLLATLFRRQIEEITGLNQVLLLLMMLNLLFNPALMLWTNRERFEFRYRKPALVTMASAILSPVIAIIAVFGLSYHAEARVFGPVIVQIISGFFCYAILFRKGKKFFQKDYWSFAFRFNLPLIFYYLSQSVLNQADRIMIRSYAGEGKAGIYSVAYSAATLILLLTSAVNGSFHPWMYKNLKAGKMEEIGKAATSLCLFVAAGTLGMTAFAPDLVRILATSEYQQAIWIIPPVSASAFFVFLYMIFANLEMYYDKNHYISVISIIAACANILLNAIFIPRYGYLAAGWTTLACYVLLAVMHFWCIREKCPAKGSLFLISLAEIGASFLMLFTYKLGYFRYGILVMEFLILYLMKDKILGLLKSMK